MAKVICGRADLGDAELRRGASEQNFYRNFLWINTAPLSLLVTHTCLLLLA
jgi:hypothetical protein